MTWQADADRFFAKVRPSDDAADCWLWTGATDPNGYGRFLFRERVDMAHRVAWALLVTDVPDGLSLDHLCRVRECVNPWHLEPVTQRLNILRGSAPNARVIQTGRCIRGHGMSDAYVRSDGRRECRTCKDARRRAAYQRRKATQAA